MTFMVEPSYASLGDCGTWLLLWEYISLAICFSFSCFILENSRSFVIISFFTGRRGGGGQCVCCQIVVSFENRTAQM